MNLITGAAGLAGSIAVREAVRQKLPFRALVRRRAQALEGVTTVEGDMARPDTLGPALDGVERVYLISSPDPRMLDTQCTFIDACRAAGVRHVVKLSGAESGIGFDAARFHFAAMHTEIERHLEGSGLAWTHLRPSQFMQIYLREAPRIVAAGALELPMGDAQLAPVDLVDVAQVAVAILRDGGHEGRSHDMTGPEALTMAEVAELIGRAIGRSVRYVDVAPAEYRCPGSRVVLATHEAFGIRPTPFADFAERHAAAFRGQAVAS